LRFPKIPSTKEAIGIPRIEKNAFWFSRREDWRKKAGVSGPEAIAVATDSAEGNRIPICFRGMIIPLETSRCNRPFF
jgi:hypothetical protein